ncbi:MAG: ABC transporter ATP-binding protein [Candidatus Hydrogenedentota bacterium]
MSDIDSSNDDFPIKVDNLSRTFGSKQALKNVSLNVPRGCVFGLLGESGAGKTTLMRHLLGLMKPQEGRVRVVRCDPVEEPESVLSQIGYLSEDRDMPGWMRIRELMRYTQGFYPDWDQAYADELMGRFDLVPEQKVRTLSRGQMAKMGLICALAHRPGLLILDEPSSGLDVVVRRHILDAVMRTVADEGRTVLFSSHLMDEVEAVSDYVAILHHGTLVLCDRLDTILRTHRKVTVEFEGPQKHGPKIDNVLLWEGRGKHWSALCAGDWNALVSAQKIHRFRILKDETPSLEDIFVARISDEPLENL